MKSLASFSTGVAFRPPRGGLSFCRVDRSDLRVTGSLASDFRLFTSFGATSLRMRAKPGALFFACAICAGSAAISAPSRASGSRVSRSSKCSLIKWKSGSDPDLLQPTLASAIRLHVAEALAAAGGEAEVELLHVLVLSERLAFAV